MHDGPTGYLTKVFYQTVFQQRTTCHDELEAWRISMNVAVPWNDGRTFTADIQLSINGDPDILVDVAFSQTSHSVREKAALILQNLSLNVTGIIVLHIHELSQFGNPPFPTWTVPITYMNKDAWAQEVRITKDVNANAFAGICINGFRVSFVL